MALSRKKKIIIGVIVGVVLVAVVVISVIATRKEEPEVVTVKLQYRPELKQTVTASGEVRPIQYIKLTSEVAGRIEEIYVQPGDLVTKGKPLVRLDPTQLQAGQEAQWAATQASINDVQNARNAVNSAQQSWSSQKLLSPPLDSKWSRYKRLLTARRFNSIPPSASSSAIPS
jgi:HlyD family secretion protein